MSETLSFPGLGLELELNRVAFTVFGHSIYWYGILIAVAFLAGALYVLLRSKTFGLDKDRIMDVVLGSVLLGIVGARLYYVLFSWSAYKDNLVSIFYIWEGGVAIYGGIIGGVLAALLVCKWRQVKLLPMLDLAAGGLLLGQAIGRWGNFVNMEAFGVNTSVKWGMISQTISWYLKQHVDDLARIGVTVDPNQPVHPTFFYESIWCLLGFAFIAWFTRRRRFDGEIALIYLGWYGLGRFFIEGLRTDSLLLGTMRISQIVALLCVIVSVLGLFLTISKMKRANDPDFMPLYVNTDEGKAVIAGTFYKKAEKASPDVSGEDEATASETGVTEADDSNEETAEIAREAGEIEAESDVPEEEIPEDGEETGAPNEEEERADGENN